MALTVTRYKAEQQRVSAANTKIPIYTVPPGKIAKITFQLGMGGFSWNWGNDQHWVPLYYLAQNRAGRNAITCSGYNQGGALWVGDVRVLATKAASYGWSDRCSLNMLPGNRPGSFITPVDVQDGKAEAFEMENEFILLPGESVLRSASDTSVVRFYYDFLVFEEDI